MKQSTSVLSHAIHTILNDVVEQCFRQMLQSPDQRKPLEEIIDQASDDISRLNKMVNSPYHAWGFSDESEQFTSINKELHKRSLYYLSGLQKIQSISQGA